MSPIRVVAEGDCISSLAFEHGLAVDTIWRHAENAELRRLRESPNQLVPGDRVFVPERRPKTIRCAAGQTHRFLRKDVPERLRLQLFDDEGRPRRGLSYQLRARGLERSGITDDDGWVEEWVSPSLRDAILELESGEIVELDIGALPPVTEDLGVIARLVALEYLADESDAELPWKLAAALAAFQATSGLAETGVIDEDTRRALVARYGS